MMGIYKNVQDGPESSGDAKCEASATTFPTQQLTAKYGYRILTALRSQLTRDILLVTVHEEDK